MGCAMIDYQAIASSIEFYQACGFQYIEVPWMVGKPAYYETKPEGVREFSTLDGFLVASGEQSFMQMLSDGSLSKGAFVCCTPCFRDEIEDEIHKRFFLKVELISVDCRDYKRLLVAAETNFIRLGAKPEVVHTTVGEDLFLNGVEVGSYGIRESSFGVFSYGTGIAEPRFSDATLLRTRTL